MAEITADHLRRLLDYNSETGAFTWRENIGSRARKGEPTGSLSNGYLTIRLCRKLYLAHRLAWLWVHGTWPPRIDHANGNPDDNRICNLRIATQSQNCANARKKSTNTSGHKGVYWNSQIGKWRVRIMRDYKNKHIGHFDNLSDAAAAYEAAAKQTFGSFARAE